MKKLTIGLLIASAFLVGIVTNVFVNSNKSSKISQTVSESVLDLPFLVENGDKISINEIEFNDKLIVNFWASGCEPCKKEIPELNNFNKGLNKNNTRLIGVAIDEMNEVLSFTKEIPLTYTNLTDEQNGFLLSRYFGNEKGVLPFTVLVDKNFQVLHKFFGEITEKDLQKVIKNQ